MKEIIQWLHKNSWIYGYRNHSWEIKGKSEQKTGPLSSPLLSSPTDGLSGRFINLERSTAVAVLCCKPVYVMWPTEDCFDLCSIIWPLLTAAPEQSDLIGCSALFRSTPPTNQRRQFNISCIPSPKTAGLMSCSLLATPFLCCAAIHLHTSCVRVCVLSYTLCNIAMQQHGQRVLATLLHPRPPSSLSHSIPSPHCFTHLWVLSLRGQPLGGPLDGRMGGWIGAGVEGQREEGGRGMMELFRDNQQGEVALINVTRFDRADVWARICVWTLTLVLPLVWSSPHLCLRASPSPLPTICVSLYYCSVKLGKHLFLSLEHYLPLPLSLYSLLHYSQILFRIPAVCQSCDIYSDATCNGKKCF